MNSFDATPSALGYIYQVRYALLLALQKMVEADDPDNCLISIETLDDVAFEESGDPVELLQVKHHSRPGNLTDRSVDLWKTIRVWSEFLANSPTDLEAPIFTLLTTENANVGSIASYLCADTDSRDVSTALNEMRSICQETVNLSNKKGYEAFLNLKPWQQKDLVNSIYVVTNFPNIIEVKESIKRHLRPTAMKHHIDAFATRLEGQWFKRVVEVMSSHEQNSISIGEVANMLDDLRTQFLPSNLPSDFDEIEPDEIDIDGDARVFVEQLRLIGAPKSTIRVAIINYYKAFEQRSRWAREGLVRAGELQTYLNKLKDEWSNQLSLIELNQSAPSEDEQLESAKALYTACQKYGTTPIRPEFQSAYVARGSYHSLSDEKRIGWHPNYLALLTASDDQGVA